MNLFQSIILGIVQGLTEFLPISSSGHLLIFPALVGWDDPGAAFTAVIQLGTEAAVLIYFRKDLWNIARDWTESIFRPEMRGELNPRMGWYLIIATIPISRQKQSPSVSSSPLRSACEKTRACSSAATCRSSPR